MKTITDLHIHSRFSRACSKDLTASNLAIWAERKGIDMLGTGDFTHKQWLSELEREFTEVAPGTFQHKDSSKTRFVLTTELSCIYKRGGKTRRVHNLLTAPNFKAVHKLRDVLIARGKNLDSDGRPILGIDSEELLKMVLDIDERFLFIPAHAWTPWFAIFGSESGFDSIEECFGENSKHIHAIETGLSSDPGMNWRLSALDNRLLVSNSDAHSLRKLGREANVFDFKEQTYSELFDVISKRDKKRLLMTIEFFPEEGKYHLDGHRACKMRCTPAETKKHGGKCPKCGKDIIVGVLSRVDEIADKPVGRVPKGAPPYKSIIPLEEVISETVGVGPQSKKVQGIYMQLTDKVGSEFYILLDAPIEEIKEASDDRIAEAIRRVRDGKVNVLGGYDGEFGTIQIFSDKEKKAVGQKTLF